MKQKKKAAERTAVQNKKEHTDVNRVNRNKVNITHKYGLLSCVVIDSFSSSFVQCIALHLNQVKIYYANLSLTRWDWTIKNRRNEYEKKEREKKQF